MNEWTSEEPTEAGFYWIRWRSPTTWVAQEKMLRKIFDDKSEMVIEYNPPRAHGVIVVRFGPKGGKRPWRWLEPIRQHVRLPDHIVEVEFLRAEVQPPKEVTR